MSRQNTQQEDYCDNCRREHVQVAGYASEEVKKHHNLMYYQVVSLFCTVFLCSHCKAYLYTNNTKCAWPSVVWRFLSSRSMDDYLVTMTIEEKWKYIPTQWRYWWVGSVDGVTVENPPAEILDVTADKNCLEEAILENKWKKLSDCMDSYLQVPSVRCPWGCGTFLHQTSLIPFEDLLLAKSNFMFKSSSNVRGIGRKWTDSCRTDYPSSAYISEHHDLRCFPSLVQTKDGVFLLSCENHNSTTTQRYIHVPVNPTGTLYTESSNQYAPVVLRSRTLRKAKINRFSDTYETVRLQGGFDGIDSCYLSSHGKYNHNHRVGQLRDSLSIQGRDDVKHHIQMLCENADCSTYVPRECINDKISLAQRQFPNLEESAKKELSSATYITALDAIALQEHTYNQKSISLTIVDNNNSLAQEEDYMTSGICLFDPPWPFKVIRVHPYDEYGERFSGVVGFKSGFDVWCHVAIVLCIDDMWTFLTESLTTTANPQGFLLSLASKQAYGSKNNQNAYKSKSIFPITPVNDNNKVKPREVAAKLGITESKFPWPSTHIDVQEYLFDPSICVNDIAVVYFYDDHMDESRETLQRGFSEWEPIVYILKRSKEEGLGERNWEGTIYARHGGHKHTNWWVQYPSPTQSLKQAHFQKLKSTAQLDLNGLYLAVYRRKNPKTHASIKERLLKCLGGQTSVYCSQHQSPLVFSGSKKMVCCCHIDSIVNKSKEWESVHEDNKCKTEAMYVCPKSTCPVSICGNHFTFLCDHIDNDCCLLGVNKCQVCPFQNRGVLFPTVDMDQAEANFPDENEPQDEYAMYTENEQDNEISSADSFIEDEESLTEEDALFLINRTNTNEEHLATLPEEPWDVDELGPTDTYDFGIDLLNAEENEDDWQNPTSQYQQEEDVWQNPFQCTEAQHDDVLQAALIAEEEIASAPLHVQLNRQGHCLVRRNAKLRMCNRHKAFFQRFVARSKGKTVPLLYSEGTVFPDIFYYSTESGDVLGAIPTALWADSTTLSRYGIASMKSHAQVRIGDPTLLTSTDSRYHFMELDILSNLGLRGNDSRVVLHRGFAEKQGKNEGVAWRKQEGGEELYHENAETHSNVYKLSRLVAESPPDYFYTQSCNQKTTKGLGVLRKWVTSVEAVQNVQKKYDITYNEAQEMIRISAAPFVQRSWNAFIDLWMRYIMYSSEEPLGPIDWAWYRKEFQDMTGNVSHIHALIKTLIDASTEEGRAQILDKIRGALADLARHAELEKFKEEGIVNSLTCLGDILEDAKKYLSHKCTTRCMVPRKDQNGNVTFVCKRQDNFLLSTNPGAHCLEEVFVEHSSTAMDIMVQCGFAQKDPITSEFQITDPSLKMLRHIPKCHKLDGKFSPTCAQLFAQYRSSQNLQNAQGHSLNAYLTSYIVEVDKVAQIHLRPPIKYDPNKFRAEHEQLHNTKIASVKHYNNKKSEAKKKPVPTGRPVTQMEALTVIQGDPLVTSNRDFIRVPTVAREYRSGVWFNYKKNGEKRPEDLQIIRAVVGQTVRTNKNFPVNRTFSNMQLEVIRDEMEAPLRSDQITIFSMRPPELLFVDNVLEYTRWFVRLQQGCPLFNLTKSIAYLEANLFVVLKKCLWIDGFQCQIVLRPAAVDHLIQFTIHRMQDMLSDRKPPSGMNGLLQIIKNCVTGNYRQTRTNQSYWDGIKQSFVQKTETRHLPVVWWTPIFPKRRTAFLVQMLLCEGRFETEYELMLTGDLKKSFQVAGLLSDVNLQSSLTSIVSTYISKHLRPLPGSRTRFDRNMVEANMALRDLYLEQQDDATEYGTPSVLYASMITETDEKTAKYCLQRRQCLIDAIYAELKKCDLLHAAPTKESILNAREEPLTQHTINSFFPPKKYSDQSEASFQEQQSLMLKFKQTVELYLNAYVKHRNFVTVGGPGVGKTTVAVFCSLYCLAIGLNGITTSLVSDRSKELGGIHFHQLISLPGRNDNISAGRAAELSISSLYKSPECLEFLKRIDFINLDELGVFSAQNMAIFDMVFRYIRQSSQFMGGVLVFCTMDHLQLLPVRGTPVMLSIYCITDFTFICLKESVRAFKDPVLQRIIELTRSPSLSDNDKDELKDLIGENCHFVGSFRDKRIPKDAVFVFGRKAPCRAAENLLLERMKTVHFGNYRTVLSFDEESTTGGDWQLASEGTSKALDRSIKHRRELLLYPNARFEFTHVLRNKFNQGQLAILLKVPTEEELMEKKPIEVYKAPSGVKQFPADEDCNEQWLLQHGWIPVKVPYDTSPIQQIGRRLQARRTQYGVKPRVSSTIHACMGSTLSSIVTCLVTVDGMKYRFDLWEQALIVVLLSRTQRAGEMYFVGNKRKTIDHIVEVLTGSQNKYIKYISSLLEKLCGESESIPIYDQPTMFRAKDAIISPVPAVYLLISTRDLHFFYIGETNNLVRRIHEHNTGNGPEINRQLQLLPFALFAYVTGFQTSNERKSFESNWKLARKRRSHIANRDNGLLEIGKDLVIDHNSKNPDLPDVRIICCGKITTR